MEVDESIQNNAPTQSLLEQGHITNVIEESESTKSTLNNPKDSSSPNSDSPDSLLYHYDDLLNTYSNHSAAAGSLAPSLVQEAESILRQILDKDPNNTKALDRFGILYLNYGNTSGNNGSAMGAKDLFMRSVGLDPENGAEKYLYLGQMSEGHEALNFFRKGLEIAKKKTYTSDSTSNSTSESSSASSKTFIPSVYVAISELYMTDLCDESDAQQNCEKALELAYKESSESDSESNNEIQVCKNVEVLTALATYNKVIQETEKAGEFALQAFKRLKELRKKEMETAVDEGEGNANGESDNQDQDVDMSNTDTTSNTLKKSESISNISNSNTVTVTVTSSDRDNFDPVPPEIQIKLVTTGIDLRMFSHCEKVLDYLLLIDEEDIQCWYLLSMIHCLWSMSSSEGGCGDSNQNQNLKDDDSDDDDDDNNDDDVDHKASSLEAYEQALNLVKKIPKDNREDKALWATNLRQLKQKMEQSGMIVGATAPISTGGKKKKGSKKK